MNKLTKILTSLAFGSAIYFSAVIGTPSADAATANKSSVVEQKQTSASASKVTSQSKTTYVTYKVKKGDTLSKIAKKYGTNYKTLMKINNLKSASIKIGQKIKVPKKAVKKAASSNTSGTKIVKEAKKHLGKPYVSGGASPKTGFDCSGYVYYVYKKSGKKIQRSSAASYYKKAKKVKNPQVGDLVFFSNTYKKGISHVGIYIGNGKMINASGKKVQIVSISSGYWKRYLTGYGRI